VPLELPPADLDDLVERYRAGATVVQLVEHFGESRWKVTEYLRSIGVLRTKAEITRERMRTMSDEDRRALQEASVAARRIPCPDIDSVLALYRSGQSAAAVGAAFGVSVDVAMRWLREAGEDTSASTIHRRRWQRLGADERAAAVRQLREARKLVRVTEESLCKRAITRERRQVQIDPNETALAEWMRRRGIGGLVQQKAIGRYNCDIAATPVAVEVFGGNWHAYGQHGARLDRRTRYILDAGWDVMLVWANTVLHPLTEVVADEVVSFVEAARRRPPGPREYRVVWGTGQLIAAGSADDDQLTLEPSGSRSDYRRASH
jgi:very-short-patch-repair endonuclease